MLVFLALAAFLLDVAAGANSSSSFYDFSSYAFYLDSIAPFYGNFSVTVGDASGTLFEYSNVDMTPDFVLPLASGSKWVGVTGLMGCFAAHNISLDDRLDKYLWWWTRNGTEAVTIRQVLSMTTGMIEDKGDNAIATVPVIAWANCSRRNGNVSECARAMYDALEGPPVFLPGTKFLYSSFGFQWAAAVAEVVGGESTGEILEKYVLGPAGMSPTCAWDNQALNPLIGGGLRCNARLLDKFVHGMLVDAIVDTNTRIEMETVQTVKPSMYGSATVYFGAYCLGNWLECLNNYRSLRPMPAQCFRADRHGHPGCGGYWNFVHRKAGYYFNFLPSYDCKRSNNFCDSPTGGDNCPALYGWAQTVRTASAMYLDDIFGLGW